MRITAAIATGFMLIPIFFLSPGAPPERVAKASPSESSAAAPATIKDGIIGTWRLDSRSIRQADGSESFDPKYGAHPVGYISYDRTGHMSVQFMRPDRPKASLDGYEAYFGTYSVDEQKKTVTHRIEGHLLPDRVGQDLVRGVEIQGDELTLIIRNSTSAAGKPVTNFNRFTRMK